MELLWGLLRRLMRSASSHFHNFHSQSAGNVHFVIVDVLERSDGLFGVVPILLQSE